MVNVTNYQICYSGVGGEIVGAAEVAALYVLIIVQVCLLLVGGESN